MKNTNNKAIRKPEWLVLLICGIISIIPAVWGWFTLAHGATYGVLGSIVAVTIMVIAGFVSFFQTQRKEVDTDNKVSKTLIISIVTAVAVAYTMVTVACWLLGSGSTSTGVETEPVTDTPVVPTVEWTVPEYTREQTITVTGKVDGVENITINGETVDVVDGNFTKDVTLVEGKNTITIGGDSKTVILDTKPPIVEMGDVQLWGTTLYWYGISTDTNGCQIFVNGTEVSINEDGAFVARYHLNEGHNSLEVKVLDVAGNETVVEQQFLYGTPELEDRTYILIPQDEGYIVAGTVNPNWVGVTVNGISAEILDNNFSILVPKPEDGKIILVFTDKVGNQDMIEDAVPETPEEPAEPETPEEPDTPDEPETPEEPEEPETPDEPDEPEEPETPDEPEEPETPEEPEEPETPEEPEEPETPEEPEEPETPDEPEEPETPDEPEEPESYPDDVVLGAPSTLLKKGQELTVTTNGHTENLKLIQTDEVCELIILDDKTVKIVVKDGVTGFAGTITLYDSRSKNGITIMVQS